METYFWREGKTIAYNELLEVLKQIINSKVIDELQQKELDKLYVRVYDTAYENIKGYLEEKNFRIINMNQGMLTATKQKLIDDKALWDEALERRQLIEQGCPSSEQSYKKMLKQFIKEDYYPALKGLESKLCKPEYGRED